MDGVIIGKAKQYVYVFQWLININDVDVAVKIIEHIPFDQAEYHLIWQIPPTRPQWLLEAMERLQRFGGWVTTLIMARASQCGRACCSLEIFTLSPLFPINEFHCSLIFFQSYL